MHIAGTALVGDIKPISETDRLTREWSADERERRFPLELVSALLGMSPAFIVRALGRPGTRPRDVSLTEVVDLLDVDGFQETFVRRSQIPSYLLRQADTRDVKQPELLDGRKLDEPVVLQGNARELLRTLTPGSIQCVVTSSPYWGMRIYENTRPLKWADGEHCQYGFEQTPEGFIRHTVELLYLLKPALAAAGSVWWNLMDTYNTRTPIRGNARQRLDAMGEVPDSRLGWTEHEACRHSAGHMFLADAEQCSIPSRVAERASRIGYRLKSYITWTKHSISPEPARSRVTRQAEYVIHLTPSAKPPLFCKDQWQALAAELGGPNDKVESKERITDVWSLPVAPGHNGHGAEFPLPLPGRCIALTSREGDVVLDPFLGSGTTALAAMRQNRRCVGFDISEGYVDLARKRIVEERERTHEPPPVNISPDQLQMGAPTQDARRVLRPIRAEGATPSADPSTPACGRRIVEPKVSTEEQRKVLLQGHAAAQSEDRLTVDPRPDGGFREPIHVSPRRLSLSQSRSPLTARLAESSATVSILSPPPPPQTAPGARGA